MTVGIICSCLPVTGPIFRKHNLESFPFAKLRSTLSFKNTFHRIKDAQPAKDILLETGVLGSAFGDGKFLKAEDDRWHTSSLSQRQEVAETNGIARHSEMSLEPEIKSPGQQTHRP